MTVGKRIKELRLKLDMSQVDFANKINVSKQTLYKYENDIITNIPSDKIEAAAKLGNVSPAYLMGWKDPAPDFVVQSDSGEKIIIECYRKLPSNSKKRLEKYATMLSNICDFEEPILNAANQRTDIKLPVNADISDDDIMDAEDF